MTNEIKTVKDLRAALVELPDDMKVIIYDYEFDSDGNGGIKFSSINKAEVTTIRKHKVLVLEHWGSISAFATS